MLTDPVKISNREEAAALVLVDNLYVLRGISMLAYENVAVCGHRGNFPQGGRNKWCGLRLSTTLRSCP
jgi:formylglycine-generating enzyme required for sulfatase activity